MTKQEFMAMSLPYKLKVKYIFDEIKTYSAIKYEAEFENKFQVINSIPILRPLSDITKPIIHNGETLVPIDYLNDYIDWEYGCEKLEYWKIKKLIEWKFNLMDESEPFIPVTDEFNPYK